MEVVWPEDKSGAWNSLARKIHVGSVFTCESLFAPSPGRPLLFLRTGGSIICLDKPEWTWPGPSDGTVWALEVKGCRYVNAKVVVEAD